MLELPHTLVGAAIGVKITNPFISLPLALASHFLLDLIPHWNPSLYSETKKYGKPSKHSTKIVILDTVASLVVGFFIASRFWPDIYQFIWIIFTCFAAVAPDVFEAPYFFLGMKSQFLERWIEFQHNHQGKAAKIPGLLIQLFIIIFALVICFS